ncbi:MAG: Xaa-Pro peptidase family protein [Candidatus Dormiibacterota bacterium]
MLLNVNRAEEFVARDGLDGVVSATVENNLYLSGVENVGQRIFPYDSQAYVVAARGRLAQGILVVSAGVSEIVTEANESIADAITYGVFFRDVDEAATLTEAEQRAAELATQGPEASALDALVVALGRAGLSNGVVGVDERGPSRSLLQDLQDRLPGATFRPCAGVFREIRRVKTADEQERLVQALRITESGIRAVMANCHTGVTELELSRVFRKAIAAGGADPRFGLIKLGRGMAVSHCAPGSTPLEDGDYVWMDVGCRFEGYQSDIGRILAFGQPSDRLVSLSRASRAGQDRAIELMTPGHKAGDVFSGAVEAVRSSGIPNYRRHHVGHGIGQETYEDPVLAPESQIALEVGMVFEVETPYYQLGFGGAFIEDTVLITEEGAKILTELPRDLQIIAAD